LLFFWAVFAQAFIHAQVGSVIEDIEMPGLDGVKHHLLSNTTANVFFFIKPGLEHTRTTLQQIARCEKEFTGKPVYWVAIVSDRIPKAEVEAEIKEAGLAMPVVIDVGDELYGKLGVALTPVAGFADQDHKLVAYQPYMKVNYENVIRAQVKHLLKEISDQELEQVLKPPEATQGGEAEVARRYLKLAERQLGMKNYEKAIENVKRSLERDTNAPAAHILLSRIYGAQENKPEALKALEQALKLDPTNAAALELKEKLK
jgi:tetratricopeptide (TPR) repeat protein